MTNTEIHPIFTSSAASGRFSGGAGTLLDIVKMFRLGADFVLVPMLRLGLSASIVSSFPRKRETLRFHGARISRPVPGPPPAAFAGGGWAFNEWPGANLPIGPISFRHFFLKVFKRRVDSSPSNGSGTISRTYPQGRTDGAAAQSSPTSRSFGTGGGSGASSSAGLSSAK